MGKTDTQIVSRLADLIHKLTVLFMDADNDQRKEIIEYIKTSLELMQDCVN